MVQDQRPGRAETYKVVQGGRRDRSGWKTQAVLEGHVLNPDHIGFPETKALPPVNFIQNYQPCEEALYPSSLSKDQPIKQTEHVKGRGRKHESRCHHKNKHLKKSQQSLSKCKTVTDIITQGQGKRQLRHRGRINEVGQEFSNCGSWGESGMWIVFYSLPGKNGFYIFKGLFKKKKPTKENIQRILYVIPRT